MIDKVLFDTSALVAAMVAAHPQHERARPLLAEALRGEVEPHVASPTLAELYTVLLRLPLKPRISSTAAMELIEHDVRRAFRAVSLTGEDYRAVLDAMAARGLMGGIVQDALVARAATIAGVQRLLTTHPHRYDQVWSGPPSVIVGI